MHFCRFWKKKSFGGENGAAGSLMNQVFIKVTRTAVKTLAWNLEFEALAAAGAQSTQFHSIPYKLKNGHQKRNFGEARAVDLENFGDAGLILAVL